MVFTAEGGGLILIEILSKGFSSYLGAGDSDLKWERKSLSDGTYKSGFSKGLSEKESSILLPLLDTLTYVVSSILLEELFF